MGNDKLYKETKYLDPIEMATDMSNTLKNEENCDLVICLSHLGYKYDSEKVDDHKLASKTENIDLIIGGHTHTFLDKPTNVKNKADKNVMINQVGCYGLYLGRVDFYLNGSKAVAGNGESVEI